MLLLFRNKILFKFIKYSTLVFTFAFSIYISKHIQFIYVLFIHFYKPNLVSSVKHSDI